MSLEALVNNSYAVEQTKSFAERFTKCETNLDKAVMAVAALILGPAALACLVLADAFRGAAYIAESLYNWDDKVIILSDTETESTTDIRIEGNLADKILLDATNLKEAASNQDEISPKIALHLDQGRKELAKKVAEHISTIETLKGQVKFLNSVMDELGVASSPGEIEGQLLIHHSREILKDQGSKEIGYAGFVSYFVLAGSTVMKEKFLADFETDFEQATVRLYQMGKVVSAGSELQLEVFSKDDVEAIRKLFETIVSENLGNNGVLQKLSQAKVVLESMGLPQEIDVISIRNEIIDQKVLVLEEQKQEIQVRQSSVQEKYNEVKAIDNDRFSLIQQMGVLSREITKLKANLKETHFNINQKISSKDPEAASRMLDDIDKEFSSQKARAAESIKVSKELGKSESELARMTQDSQTLLEMMDDKLGGKTLEGLLEEIFALQGQREANESQISELKGIKESTFAFLDSNDDVDVDDVDDVFVGLEGSPSSDQIDSTSTPPQLGGLEENREEEVFHSFQLEEDVEEVKEKTPERTPENPSVWQIVDSFFRALNGIDA